MPTSLPSLPSRGQPFPFILPQPLGPLSSPTRSSSQADLTARASAPSTPALPGTSTWGSRGAYLDQSGGFVMPHPTSSSTAGFTRRTSLGNVTGPDSLPSRHGLPPQSESQVFWQPSPNRWHAPATERHFPPRREEHASPSGLEISSAGRTHGENSEAVHYHKCDECHEAFTTSSWLKRHKTTHFRRFRCGCGAAYIDKMLLLVSKCPWRRHLRNELKP